MASRGVWLSLVLHGLIVFLLNGCGGGDQDFGPTRKPGLSSAASKPSDSAINAGSVTANSIAHAKPKSERGEEESVAEDGATEAAQSSESTTTVPTPSNNAGIAAKPEKPLNIDKTANNAEGKSATASGVLKGTDQSEKTIADQANSAKRIDSVSDSVGSVRQPLSAELREWLLSKRRQAGSRDGLALLTAVDLSKMSLHDLRSSQLSHEFFGKNGRVTALAIGPNQSWVIGATDAGWMRLWTIESHTTGLDRFARESVREAQASQDGIDTEQGGVLALATSPQGKWMLAGGDDGSLRVMTVETASITSTDRTNSSEPPVRLVLKLGEKFEAHVGTVTDIEVSEDGLWIVSGGSDSRVCLRDAKTWKETHCWTDSPEQITDVGVSADGKVVAASCLDKSVRWWSVVAPEPSPEALPASKNEKPAKSLVIANKTSTGADKSTAKDAKPKNVLEHPDIVLSVAVSADGRFVATGCNDKSVRVWDLSTGKILEKHDGAKDAVVEVRFLDGDKRLFLRDRSGLVRSKLRTRQNTNDEEPPPPEAGKAFQFVTSAALLNPNPQLSVAASETVLSPEAAIQQVALRNAVSRETRALARKELLKTMNPDTDDGEAAKRTQVAALEKQLASTTNDTVKADIKRQLSRLKTTLVSQEKTEQPKRIGTLTSNFQFDGHSTNPVQNAARSVQLSIYGDGEFLSAITTSSTTSNEDEGRRRSESTKSQLWAWDIATQTLLRHWDDLPNRPGSCSLVESTNQVMSDDGQVFSLTTGQSRALSDLTLDQLSTVATAPDGRHLAVGYVGSPQIATQVLRLFDVATMQEVKSHEAYEGLASAVAFAPDCNSLAVAIRERLLHRLLILDATTLAPLATLEEQTHAAPWLQGIQSESQDRGLTMLRFSSDGRYLLTHGTYGNSDYRLTLWQKKGTKWTRETAVSTKASQPIVDDARSPTPIWFVNGKGSQLAAISSKGLGIVEISNGRLTRSLELRQGHNDHSRLAWSSDGTWLAQGDDSGYVTLWNLRTDKEAAIFAAQLGPLKTLALSHDGRVLATLGEENKLHLWNLEGWQPKNRVAAKAKTTKPTSVD